MVNLIIVESPTKAKVIKKYLDNNFIVLATRGHIRDLPKKFLGIDLKNNFSPTFHFLPRKRKTIEYITKKAQNADTIYIATDPDREGEAIGWHLTQVLKTRHENYKRLLLHEISRDYVIGELSAPKNISINLVFSQFARRIVDRLFGYIVSPYISKNLKMRASAGRVQSPALRLIYEREIEIKNFKRESLLEITAKFLLADKKHFISAKLKKWHDCDTIPYSEGSVENIKKEIEKSTFFVINTKQIDISKSPPPPFNTPSLLIECAKNFGWTSYKTQKLAQMLYEGILVDGEYKSLITYPRTDSLRISEKFLEKTRQFIKSSDFRDYLNPSPRKYKRTEKFAQQAHEAIRPVDLSILPHTLEKKIFHPLYKLYKLIWETTIATQLKPATYKRFEFEITNQNHTLVFHCQYQFLIYNGYKIIHNAKNESIPLYLNEIKKGDILEIVNPEFNKIDTTPPCPYTEASLIRQLKKLGIGRPSTYAYIISTLIKRGHIKKLKGYLHCTEKGIKTIEVLLRNFQELIDYNFTEKLEKELDRVEEGKKNYVEVIDDFYKDLKESIRSSAG
ncbi:MAG: type I DNA topoisomerase [Planctomycetota bacterium]